MGHPVYVLNYNSYSDPHKTVKQKDNIKQSYVKLML